VLAPRGQVEGVVLRLGRGEDGLLGLRGPLPGPTTKAISRFILPPPEGILPAFLYPVNKPAHPKSETPLLPHRAREGPQSPYGARWFATVG
jgi:hypothetical protein